MITKVENLFVLMSFIILLAFGCSKKPVYPIAIEVDPMIDITNVPENIAATLPAVGQDIIQTLCPEDKGIELISLDLPEALRLLVQDDNLNVLKVMSTNLDELKTIQIPDTSRLVSLNQDGNRIVYTHYTDEQRNELWVVETVTGNQVKIIDDLGEDFQRISWLGNSELALWYRLSNEVNSDAVYANSVIKVFNLDTKQSKTISVILLNSYKNLLFLNEDASKIAFLSEREGLRYWEIYETKSEIVQTLLPLQGSIRFQWSPGNNWFALLDGDLAVFDANTLDLIQHIPLTPLEEGTYDVGFIQWDQTSQQLAFELVYHSDLQANIPPQGLYVHNFHNNRTQHYCVDTNISPLYGLHWSPDGNYIGWTTTDEISAIIILDINNGKFAKLSGYQLLGWGTNKD